MRSPQKSNRPRGRGSRKGGGGSNINRVYESAGPDGKVRGTAQQIIDKYLSLARDAQTVGDRVNAENFLQHAEHYQRILAAALGQQQERRDQAQSSDEDDGSEGEAHEQQEEQAERSAPAERPRREKASEGTVDGMQTFDANDGADGPDLLVTEESGPSRNRRRRSAARQPKAEGGEDTAAAESAAE